MKYELKYTPENHNNLAEQLVVSTWKQGLKDWRAVGYGYCCAGDTKLLAEKCLLILILKKLNENS